MSDIIEYFLIFCLALFYGFMSFLFLKDVFPTIKARLWNDRNTTTLTRWQMFYHVFIGILTGVFALLLLFGIILLIDIRSKNQ